MTIQRKKRGDESLMGVERYIAELLDVLKMEVRSFTTVIELLILEEKSLVACDTAALADVIDRQGDVLSSIACLEKSRLDILDRIAREQGKRRDDMDLSEIAGLVGDPFRKDLIETGTVLASIYEDMKRKKVSNTLLIRQGIMLVENDIRILMKALGRDAERSVVYSRKAASTAPAGSIRVDGRM